MQTKSQRHIRGWKTRKADRVDAYIPKLPFQLPKDAGGCKLRGCVSGGVALFIIQGVEWYHTVSELREWTIKSSGRIVTGATVRMWLKVAVSIGLLEVRVQPLTSGERLLFMREGQLLDDKYLPYLTMTECNQRFMDKNGEGHPERSWW